MRCIFVSNVNMDDRFCSNLIKLQYNLENSLCYLAEKYNSLSRKVSSAAPSDKSKVSDIGQRRTSVSESKPYKRTKLSSENTQKSSFSVRAKSKRTQPAKSQENGFSEKASDIPKVQKSDSLNRFWAFYDSYCADITTEDISVLEKWIESHERNSDYQNIPELGEHYSSKWREDDIIDELKEGNKSMENPKGIDYVSEENRTGVELLRKKAEEKTDTFKVERPPLIEKLIMSLVQENIITPNDMMSECISDDDCEEKDAEETTLKLSESTQFESRLKLQLAELGIIDDLNVTRPNPPTDDELLQELKRLQVLLIPISNLNLQKKKALLLRSKAEIAKQEAQKRIQEADAKVMESYRTMAAARSKGKKLGKKELSQIRNMLEERDMLIRNTKEG